MVLRDHATKVLIQLLNVNAHIITINKFGSLNETHRLMIKPRLAFVSTSRHNLSDFDPGLALRSRSARLLLLPHPRQPAQAYSYRQGLLHGECKCKT
jgi:hypothetical protein